MTSFVENVIEENKDLHTIAYSSKFIVGYDKTTKRACYITETFESDLISRMPYEYQDWVGPLLDALNIEIETVDDDKEYYEKLTFL